MIGKRGERGRRGEDHERDADDTTSQLYSTYRDIEGPDDIYFAEAGLYL